MVFILDIDFAFKNPYAFGFFKETLCCEILKKLLQSNMRRKQWNLLYTIWSAVQGRQEGCLSCVTLSDGQRECDNDKTKLDKYDQ